MATAEGLHNTVETCRFRHLKFLLDLGTGLDLKNEQGEGVLVTALKISNEPLREKMFYFLLKKGAKCDDVDSRTGRDIFIWTCYLGLDTQVKQLLTHSLGDINFQNRDSNGSTGLHYLVKAGKLDLVSTVAKCMKKFGISVDIPDFDRVTPLIHAKRLGLTDIVEALVQEGNACSTQFDPSISNPVRSLSTPQKGSSKPRRVASAFCSRTIYYSLDFHNNYNQRRCFSSTSRSSSKGLNDRKVSDGDISLNESSVQSEKGHTASRSQTPKEAIRASSVSRSLKSASPRTCWTSVTTTNTWEEGSSHDRGTTVVPRTSPSIHSSTQSHRTTSVAPSSTIQHPSTKTKTNGQHRSSSGKIDVTRTLSTHTFDSCYSDSKCSKPTASAVRRRHRQLHIPMRDVRGVQKLFQYMSMELSPAFRPTAEAKNAYQPPVKPKPTPKVGTTWGIVSVMTKLKAKSQRLKMQSLAKNGRTTPLQLQRLSSRNLSEEEA